MRKQNRLGRSEEELGKATGTIKIIVKMFGCVCGSLFPRLLRKIHQVGGEKGVEKSFAALLNLFARLPRKNEQMQGVANLRVGVHRGTGTYGYRNELESGNWTRVIRFDC